MDEFKIFKKNTSVVCKEVPDGAVLLNLETKYYYNLNKTGFRIWQMIGDDQSPLDIARKLVYQYEIELEGALASVLRLIEQLEREGLIVSN